MNLISSIRQCPICDYNNQRNFRQFEFLNEYYNVVICNSCGFVFQNPIKPISHYQALECSYPKNYDLHSIRRAEYIVDFCKSYISTSGTINILDIGAGFGSVLNNIGILLSNSKYKVGITLENLNDIKKTNHTKLYNFNVEDEILVDKFIQSMGNQQFDFIIMSHVLEHFIDPNKAIKNIKKLMSSNTILYIEVPSLYNTEYRTKSVWRPEHLSYFTESSLSYILKINGLRINKLKDSKIWGNIKVVCTPNIKKSYFEMDAGFVENIYESEQFAKFIQRLKHKLHFKYGNNE